MSTVLDAIIVIAVVIIGGWVVIFGVSAALYSRSRGGTTRNAFVAGALAGPIGWGYVWWRTRGLEPWEGDDREGGRREDEGQVSSVGSSLPPDLPF